MAAAAVRNANAVLDDVDGTVDVGRVVVVVVVVVVVPDGVVVVMIGEEKTEDVIDADGVVVVTAASLLVTLIESPNESFKLLSAFRLPSNIFFRRLRTKLEADDDGPELVSDKLSREKSDLILEFGASP